MTRNGENNRQDRLIKEKIHDTYMMRSKPSEPTVCPDCQVVFSGGRWQWLETIPQGGHSDLCPACMRIRDDVPAGILSLSGEFLKEHRNEIMNLVKNKVEEQRSQRPMKRLMSVDEQADETILKFTDNHLPRGVGQSIQNAYEGSLDIHYTEEAGIVRVYWER